MGSDQSTTRRARRATRLAAIDSLYNNESDENNVSDDENEVSDIDFFMNIKNEHLTNNTSDKSFDDLIKMCISVDSKKFLKLLFKNIYTHNINYEIWIQLYPEIFEYKTLNVELCNLCKNGENTSDSFDSCKSCECSICLDKYNEHQCIYIKTTKQLYHKDCLIKWWYKKKSSHCPLSNINIINHEHEDCKKVLLEWTKLKSLVYNAIINELNNEELIYYHYICYLGIAGKSFI
jgi:hypothetical protein